MTHILCVNRKFDDEPVKRRQAAFIDRLAEGSGGRTVSWETAKHLSDPVIIRGLTFRTAIKEMISQGRRYYYVDNGYFGNAISKQWFRIIKNHLHDVRPIISRDRSRLDRCIYQLKPRSHGRNILLAPPSAKSFTIWDIDQQQWIQDTIMKIQQYTDRPVVIREKRSREERMTVDTMDEALSRDVHCLVTYNSVAAVEAVMAGKPAICLGPNAAQQVSSRVLEDIDHAFFPDDDLREAWLRHLSYSQFTFMEMSDGTAWRILNE